MEQNNLRELPADLKLPEKGIGSEEMYRIMYSVVSEDEEMKRLRNLHNKSVKLEGLWEETKYENLIDAGLAVRNTGAGDPYIKITSLGEVFAEYGAEDGLRELVKREYEIVDRYSSDS